MKTLLILAATFFFASTSMDQVNGITIEEYPVQIKCHKDSIDLLLAPVAVTDCDLGGLSVSKQDKRFSGGRLGTLQREWTYSDSCGFEGKAVQYIGLTE